MVLNIDYEYSKGNGTGVAEAVGNWGFAHGISSKGNELQRIECVLEKIECLGSGPTQKKPPVIHCKVQPFCVGPSPKECQPAWMDPLKRPLMTYVAVNDVFVRSDLKDVRPDLAFPIPRRFYLKQGSPKWYKQHTTYCPAPVCCHACPNH